MIRTNCAHLNLEGAKCGANRTEHVHLPIPCENGYPERHHDFVKDRDTLRNYYPDLLADIQAVAPALTRCERVELRKALLA